MFLSAMMDPTGNMFLAIFIPQNKVTAIVGASGSGKTTLIKLLLGFYIPNKGNIKIDQTPLQEINPHLWRQKKRSRFTGRFYIFRYNSK